ncbi:NAD(P)/FAD-dependent oxidoreductase [Rhizobium sp. G21]|uniref:NAD(P)/FAD-dependent oxidoreductase n=1 Tax=Rhizobium sp. G21 TaxID=2758439 RepID=UPI001FEE195D|nr:FAD-dependent oxidoreductase [Rhizobium sp. G21]
MKTVIIGGSHAALSAAAELRKLSAEAEIVIVSSDAELPYQRPPLSKAYMSGKSSFEQILLRPEDWYAANRITLIRGVFADRIDRAHKTVHLADGEALSYDRLLIAAGARPRRLPEEIGGHLPNVHVMRDLGDAHALMEQMKDGARLVVIGGGYIGLEAASEASKKGATVTVIEAADRILKRVACAETAGDVRTLHQAHGVRIFENAALKQIVEDGGRATGVELSDGSVIAADFIVTGIGVTPDVALADQAGLTIANGVVVDRELRSSDPEIFAIGDCASFPMATTISGSNRCRTPTTWA